EPHEPAATPSGTMSSAKAAAPVSASTRPTDRGIQAIREGHPGRSSSCELPNLGQARLLCIEGSPRFKDSRLIVVWRFTGRHTLSTTPRVRATEDKIPAVRDERIPSLLLHTAFGALVLYWLLARTRCGEDECIDRPVVAAIICAF